MADVTLDEILEHAAEHLPEGAVISIHVERGAAWVETTNAKGESRSGFETADMSIVEQVADCVAWCKGGAA